MSEPMPLIFSNDDIGFTDSAEHVQWFREVVEFLNGRKISATFFWVPMADDRPSSELTDWMKAIREAMDQGHDVQLHGLGHGCLDFGVPQSGLRRENPGPFEEIENNRTFWQREHSYRRLRAKLERGIELYEQAFGQRPVIFRAPCVGVCSSLYEALYDVGLRYSSSRIVNPNTWVYAARFDAADREWWAEFPPHPFMVRPGVKEYPVMSDYSHYPIPDERFDDLLSLAKQDYQHLMAEGREVGVMLCHYHSMHRDWKQTVRFYNAFLDWLGEQGWANFVTFRDLLAGH